MIGGRGDHRPDASPDRWSHLGFLIRACQSKCPAASLPMREAAPAIRDAERGILFEGSAAPVPASGERRSMSWNSLTSASWARGRQGRQGHFAEEDRAGRGQEERLWIGYMPPDKANEPLRVTAPVHHAGAIAGQVDRATPDGQREPGRSGRV